MTRSTNDEIPNDEGISKLEFRIAEFEFVVTFLKRFRHSSFVIGYIVIRHL